jgi:WD40 repeat protein
MADVFISYSRKDKAFVQRLHQALAAQQRDTWIDWEDIPATADWWKEIQGGIESADSFIFIISPDSVRSDVCRREIEAALNANKRFVPLLYRPLDAAQDQQLAHPAINSHNWIFFRETDDFNSAMGQLTSALDTDLSHVRAHTRLMIRAREWESNASNRSYLLQGDDLLHAEAWLAEGVAKKPAPTALHAAYITESRQAATQRQRRLLAGVTVALVVALGLAILSLLLFGEANRQQDIAWNNAATATIAQGEAEIQAQIAFNNAATATIAQGEAEIQAQIALNNAATATIAQGNAEFQRGTAVANAIIAQNNAATATIAQGEAEAQRAAAQQAATAVANERNRAQSVAISGQAQVELAGPLPERAPLLALQAVLNFGYSWQAERALAASVREDLEQRTLSGHSDEVSGVDWSGDSQRILTSSNDMTARVWGLNGELLLTLAGHAGSVTRALFSPDDTRIATASLDDTAKLWDATSGAQLATLRGHSDDVLNLDWAMDGWRLVTASRDGTARIWDSNTGEVLFTLSGHNAAVNYAGWSPDGRQVVTAGGDGTARIWDAATGDVLHVLSGHRSAVLRAVYSPDGLRIVTASADNTARVWDVRSGELVFTLSGHVRRVTRALWSPDDRLIATVSADGSAKVWDARTGELLRTLFGHTASVNGVAWSPGGRRLITVSDDRSARIWATENGGELLVFPGHTGIIYSVAWSPDGRYFASASADGTARIWQIWTNARSLAAFAQSCCADRILTDEENIQFGLPTATALPVPAELVSCPNTLPSRLYPGARGQVTEDDDPSALNVRREPSTASGRIGQVAPGQTFQVIGGPTCAENIAWFEIIYGISALQGWIAEGQNGVYFAQPRAG